MNTEKLKWLAEPLAAPNGADSNASWWDAFHRAANPAAILALIQQRDELLAALEQERKRLDWALKYDSFYDHTTGVFFCDPAFKVLNPQVRVETDDPRATIDSLMAQS